MDLLTIESKLKEKNIEEREITKKHKIEIAKIKEERRELERLKVIYMQGVDMAKILISERCLEFKSGFNRFNENIINMAINDISLKRDEMREEYFGIKDYAHFRGQEVQCKYNYGPKHGHVVFRVGLTPSAIKNGLSDEERNACLYYLNLLLDDVEFRENAR